MLSIFFPSFQINKPFGMNWWVFAYRLVFFTAGVSMSAAIGFLGTKRRVTSRCALDVAMCFRSKKCKDNLDVTLPETNSSHLKMGHPKRKVVFQPSIFRCKLAVSFRECKTCIAWPSVQIVPNPGIALGVGLGLTTGLAAIFIATGGWLGEATGSFKSVYLVL